MNAIAGYFYSRRITGAIINTRDMVPLLLKTELLVQRRPANDTVVTSMLP